jgi:hypothetical protein
MVFEDEIISRYTNIVHKNRYTNKNGKEETDVKRVQETAINSICK